MSERLTPEQVDRWRKILLLQFGPMTLRFSDDDINRIRDRYQEAIDKHERMIDCLRDGGEMIWTKSTRTWYITSRRGEHAFNLTAHQATEILGSYRNNLKRSEHLYCNVYVWKKEEDE